MPVCKNCKETFSPSTIVKGKHIDLRRRKYCLKCNPFGERRFWAGKKTLRATYGLTDKSKRVLLKVEFICKKCNKTYKQKTRNRVCSTCLNKERRNRQKEKGMKYAGGECFVCGYNKCCSLDFHHIDAEEKVFDLARIWNKNWELIKTEIDKCILLCKNCHGELHSGLFDLTST